MSGKVVRGRRKTESRIPLFFLFFPKPVNQLVLVLKPAKVPKLFPWYSIVPYCTVLYCTVLYCTVLYCTVLYCTVLYCTVLYCTVLYCTVLYCTVLCGN